MCKNLSGSMINWLLSFSVWALFSIRWNFPILYLMRGNYQIWSVFASRMRRLMRAINSIFALVGFNTKILPPKSSFIEKCNKITIKTSNKFNLKIHLDTMIKSILFRAKFNKLAVISLKHSSSMGNIYVWFKPTFSKIISISYQLTLRNQWSFIKEPITTWRSKIEVLNCCLMLSKIWFLTISEITTALKTDKKLSILQSNLKSTNDFWMYYVLIQLIFFWLWPFF